MTIDIRRMTYTPWLYFTPAYSFSICPGCRQRVSKGEHVWACMSEFERLPRYRVREYAWRTEFRFCHNCWGYKFYQRCQYDARLRQFHREAKLPRWLRSVQDLSPDTPIDVLADYVREQPE